jgi:hypothetical protein
MVVFEVICYCSDWAKDYAHYADMSGYEIWSWPMTVSDLPWPRGEALLGIIKRDGNKVFLAFSRGKALLDELT